MKYVLCDKQGNTYGVYSSRELAESVYVEAIHFRELIIREVVTGETNLQGGYNTYV